MLIQSWGYKWRNIACISPEKQRVAVVGIDKIQD